MWEQGSSGERRRRGEVGGGKERREEVEGRRGAGEEGTGGGEGWGRAGERRGASLLGDQQVASQA